MRLLLISLAEPEAEAAFGSAYSLLAQRLVLKAIRESRSAEIAFWDCPKLAASFGCDAQTGHPDLQGRVLLSVLGSPPWLALEGSPWTEVMVPNSSLTGYSKIRIKPVDREVGRLMQAGATQNLATKLIEAAGGLEALQLEAARILAGLGAGKKLKDLGTIFKRRSDAEVAASVELPAPVEVKSRNIVEMLSELS